MCLYFARYFYIKKKHPLNKIEGLSLADLQVLKLAAEWVHSISCISHQGQAFDDVFISFVFACKQL